MTQTIEYEEKRMKDNFFFHSWNGNNNLLLKRTFFYQQWAKLSHKLWMWWKCEKRKELRFSFLVGQNDKVISDYVIMNVISFRSSLNLLYRINEYLWGSILALGWVRLFNLKFEIQHVKCYCKPEALLYHGLSRVQSNNQTLM